MKRQDYNLLNDVEIINTIKKNNAPEYFEVLYNRYYRKVLNKCHSLVKKRSLAEELAEDVFSKVFEKLSTFKQLSSFSSWLYSITYNHCIDYLREEKKLHYPKWNNENEIPEIIDDTDEIIEDINYDNLMDIMEQT